MVARLDLERQHLEFALAGRFSDVKYAGAKACAVDIPIGPRDDFAPRPCDTAARQLLGRQASSIFPAPPRALLHCRTQAEASALSRATCGRGVSIQSFHLFAKIAEVDALRPLPVFEAHPELAFLTRAGVTLPSKKTAEGYAARLALLSAWSGLPSRDAARQWRSRVAPDDLLDAAVLAEVAWRHTRGEARCVGDPAEAAIWY